MGSLAHRLSFMKYLVMFMTHEYSLGPCEFHFQKTLWYTNLLHLILSYDGIFLHEPNKHTNILISFHLVVSPCNS